MMEKRKKRESPVLTVYKDYNQEDEFSIVI